MRLSIIAEDLRLPLDEGMKKTSCNVIRSLIRGRVDVKVFTQYATSLPFDTVRLPNNKLLLSYDFFSALRMTSPDIVLYIPTSSGTSAAFIRATILKALSSGAPIGLFNLQFRRPSGTLRYLGIPSYVDVVFTQSRASTNALASLGFKTVLLPGGVDNTVFRPVDARGKRALRAKYGFTDSMRIVLHVGHVKQCRNVKMLADLAEKGYQVVLIASTSTALDPALLNDLKRAGVMVITDYIESIQDFYQLADCYLFPPSDAMSAIDAPLSVLEAMACNLPVVTTRFGALTTMFETGNGFYFFDCEDDVAPIIGSAIANQSCMTSEMVSRYSWDNLASILLQAFAHPVQSGQVAAR